MKNGLNEDFFFNPEEAFEEGQRIRKAFSIIQKSLDEISSLESRMIDVAGELPAYLRNAQFIDSCRDTIREINQQDFDEYGARVSRVIMELDSDSLTALERLRGGLEGCRAQVSHVIPIVSYLKDEINYDTYQGISRNNPGLMLKIDNELSAGKKQEYEEKQERLFEIDEVDAYLNFIMTGRHESTSYFELREKYRKQLLDKIEKGEEAEFTLLDGSTVTFYPTGTSFYSAVARQEKRENKKMVYDKQQDKSYAVDATHEEIADAMNPYKHLEGSDKYEFLDISIQDNISVPEIQAMLGDSEGYKDCAQYFYDAAKENEMSVVYLVSHSCSETRYGEAAKLSANGESARYDYFGYGAFDSNPIKGMEEAAESNDWTTREKAIKGGAKCIKQGYLVDGNQRTREDMQWNPLDTDGEGKQYATDINWAFTQVHEPKIKEYYDNMRPEDKHYIIPFYYENEGGEGYEK